MHRFTRLAASYGLIALVSVICPPGRYAQIAQSAQNQDEESARDRDKKDPCEQADNSSGKANGLHRKCTPRGGSGGVARGDYNGDGIGDLAVGEPGVDLFLTTFTVIDVGPPPVLQGSTRLVPDAGAVHVVYGSANDGLTPAGHTFHDQGAGKNDNNHFGTALAAGRFNIDPGAVQFSDLAVGVPGARNNNVKAGAIYVFNGSSTGLLRNPSRVLFANQFSTTGTVLGGQFPATLTFPENMSMVWGDFNGDTVGDLAVEVGQLGATNPRSAVLVLFGSATGLSASNFTLLVIDDGLSPNNFPNPPPPPGQPDQCNRLVFCATSRGDVSLAAGRLDSDLIDDLVIGDPDCNEVDDQGRTVGSGHEGCVIIINGRTPGGLSSFGWRVLKPGGEDRRRRFGAALAIGDFDGDSNKDLAVSAPDAFFEGPSNAGSVRVFDGKPAGLGSQSGDVGGVVITQNTIGVETSEADDEFGAALAANDFDGDGIADLAIGVPGETVGTKADAGAVIVVHGSLNGLDPAVSVNHPGALLLHEGIQGVGTAVSAGERFGASLTAWNFGKTIQADLAIGTPFENLIFQSSTGGVGLASGAGAVHVFYGSPSLGLSTSGSQFWSQTSVGETPQSGAHFGAAIY